MVDNFELIKPMFYFNEANDMFFHLQIVQRAKDHKGENRKVKEGVIKTYFIKSREHLDRVKEEVIFLCEHYSARAYINVSGKDFSALQNLMLAKLAEYNLNGTVRDPRRILNSAAGELKSRSPKWVVDVDDVSMLDNIRKKVCELYYKAHGEKGQAIPIEDITDRMIPAIVAEFPTKSGVHLIARPFNLKEFHDTFPDVDVHKNSMGTVLYIPDSLKHRYVCSECGSPNVQVPAWVNANTNEYVSDLYNSGECWCEDCMKHTKLKEV